ncbi:7-cyano-7-deazaguanine synthase QueC [Candidatus Peregrinibacteria bacterium]|nr:7-cyano-7-deazaguanine synthase QueC [Candidatus Peregrinibacteria bacterium]
MKNKPSSAVILLSGGQDSTTCLAWAMQKFDEIFALTIHYGQLHKIELESAKKIARLNKIPLKIYKTDLFKEFTKNALLNKEIAIKIPKNKLPSTFVPGRNLIFLSIAAIYAKQLDTTNIITGVCQTDYSGYPDCRDNFIKSLEKTLSLAMETKFKIHTPLMWLTKAETVKLMQQLGKIGLLKHTHTCYKGKRPACGKCPACLLRLKGFKEAGIKDSLPYK